MPLTIDQLKDAVKKLPPRAFERFAAWIYTHAAKLEYEAQADDSNGIAHQDVLRVFERQYRIFRRKPDVLDGASGAACMASFYEQIRVRGCAFENDADMILAEWGPREGDEFRVAYTRQLIPPLPSGDEQIWQLSLDMRFADSKQLRKLGAGTRWFRSLRDREKLLHFSHLSRIGRAVENMKPSRVLLTYQNVE
jgi:hypothetical protein